MIMSNRDRDIIVAALKHAGPYIRMFKRKVFVIKAGGELFMDADRTEALVEQIALLHQVGIRVVIVHGAGPQSTQMAAEQGLQTRMVQGRRITDEATLRISVEVNRQVREQIVAMLEEYDVPAIGMGADSGSPILAKRRGPVDMPGEGRVDFGLVGDIESIDAGRIRAELDAGRVPVISPVSPDSSGALLNINADTVAAALASALQAEKLILATGTAGILEDIRDPHSVVSYIDLDGLNRMRAEGSLADGMLPKAKAIEAAIHGGVPRVHVISYKLPDSLLLEIFTNEGNGTLVVRSIEALSPEEQGVVT